MPAILIIQSEFLSYYDFTSSAKQQELTGDMSADGSDPPQQQFSSHWLSYNLHQSELCHVAAETKQFFTYAQTTVAPGQQV